MTLSLGIIGLPNVGKSTLFNTLTKLKVASETYPFTTIEPNIAMVEVPDERLFRIMEIVKAELVNSIHLKFIDIAGLVKGAHKGEGLGNKFLSHIRKADALLHVVRVFRDERIEKIGGKGILEDVEIINTELILKDLEVLEKIKFKLEKSLKSTKEKNLKEEYEIIENLERELNQGRMIKDLKLTNNEEDIIRRYDLLTNKPTIYILNIGEEDRLEDLDLKELNLSPQMAFCIKIEEELSRLSKEDETIFRKELGINSSPLNSLLKKAYKLLNLITYFTIEKKKLSAWSIKKGTRAKKAAGKVHTDMEKGFIAAEVIPFSVLDEIADLQEIRKRGLVRIEGKDYLVGDGDIICFKFSI
jgi:hypothetical protein